MDRRRLTALLAATLSLAAAAPSGASEIVLSHLGERGRVVVLSRGDRRSVARDRYVGRAVWSPSHARIAYEASSGKAGFEEVKVTSRRGGRKRSVTGFGWITPSWHPDGRLTAACRHPGACEWKEGLYLIDLRRPDERHRLARTGGGEQPAWAPGGERLVFVSPRHGRGDLFVKRLGRSRLRRLTRSDVDEAGPDWSPDGRWIVYSRPPRHPQQPHDLWLVSPDGRRSRRLTRTKANETNPDWSPSGRRLLFTTGRGLFTVRRDGTHRRRVEGSRRGDCCADW